jgi:thioredoxin-like negative regulator of GroEL
MNDNPVMAKEKFMKLLENKKTFLCYYYWKNCGHCTHFNPIWNKLVQNYNDKLIFVKIELECMKSLPQSYAVNGFPTIILFKTGAKFKEFQENRDEKTLHNFIKKYVLDVPNTKEKPKKGTKTNLRNY